jgi:phosphohistidine phosphatase SixA
MHRLVSVILLLLIGATGAAAQSTIFLVRHAERADGGAQKGMMGGDDPDLSAAGRARAQSLARMLKDAGITAIYTTEYKRTKQTAEPLAKVLGIEPTAIPSKDATSLGQKLKTVTGNVLVVGHSNSVPGIIKDLGVGDSIAIADDEYDNLFVVVRGSTPTLVRLRYR